MDRQLVEAAKNYRLTVLEKKAEYHDRELTELRQLIGRLSSDVLMKSAIKKPELALPVMEVPKEISYRPQNGKRCATGRRTWWHRGGSVGASSMRPA